MALCKKRFKDNLRMTKDNLVYLKHILNSVEIILKSTNGKAFDMFLNKEFLADSVIRHFQVIGETSKKVDKDFKNQFPQFPWKQMGGMRNKLVH